MVSNAKEDFPEPESPVKTISLLRGISRLTFFRLCSRAPLTIMFSCMINYYCNTQLKSPLDFFTTKSDNIRQEVVKSEKTSYRHWIPCSHCFSCFVYAVLLWLRTTGR